MSFKINDRVKFINETSSNFGRVGKIIKNILDGCDYCVLFNDGTRKWFDEEDNELELVKPSFDTLLVGDIIEEENGYEAKVLEVGVNSFLKSYFNDFDESDEWFTFKEAKLSSWKVKGQEEEPKEMTVKEISEKLGYEIKVIKEK